MDYKTFATNLAKQAGKIMLANFALGMKKQWKADSTPVTVTDKKINKMVIDAVKKNFPAHDVLGEEQSYRPNGGEYLWVCDPVDGTLPFSHGVPTFVFSLALVKDGRPILGIIYDAMLNRMVVAEAGRGAFLNGKRTKVSKKTLIGSAVGWDTWVLSRPAIIPNKTPFYFTFNSILYAAMLVACGEFTGAICSSDKPHDAAAAKIIIEEAGGAVTDMAGKEQRYDKPINGVLMSNGKVHKQLLQILKDRKKKLVLSESKIQL